MTPSSPALELLGAIQPQLAPEELRAAQFLASADAAVVANRMADISSRIATARNRCGAVATVLMVGAVLAVLQALAVAADAIEPASGVVTGLIIAGLVGLSALMLHFGKPIDWSRPDTLYAERAQLAGTDWMSRGRIAELARLSPRARQWCEVVEAAGRPYVSADFRIVEELAEADWAHPTHVARTVLQGFQVDPFDRPYSLDELANLAGVPSTVTGCTTPEAARALLTATDADLDGQRAEHRAEVDRYRRKAAQLEQVVDWAVRLRHGVYLLLPAGYWTVVTELNLPWALLVPALVGLAGVLAAVVLMAYLVVCSIRVPLDSPAVEPESALAPLGVRETAAMLGCLVVSPIARAWHHQVVGVAQRQLRKQDLVLVRSLLTPNEMAAATVARRNPALETAPQ